jgi:Transposase
VIHATVMDKARKRGGSEETIAGRRARWIERAVDGAAWERLGGIGLDEIARTRGHRALVGVVTGPRAGGGVESRAVWAARPQETVAACLRAIPAPLRHTIERACTAMDAGCGRAIAAEVPWAELVSDRFHVAWAYRDGADTVRTQERTRPSEGGPKPRTRSAQERWGRFADARRLSSRRRGTCGSGCSRTRPRGRRLTTCGKP